MKTVSEVFTRENLKRLARVQDNPDIYARLIDGRLSLDSECEYVPKYAPSPINKGFEQIADAKFALELAESFDDSTSELVDYINNMMADESL